MTDTNDEPDVDQLLRSNGTEWRAGLPPTPDPYPNLERRAKGRRPAGASALLAAFAGVLAIVVIGVLVIVSLPPRDQGFAAATASPSTSATTAASVVPTPTSPEETASPAPTPTQTASATDQQVSADEAVAAVVAFVDDPTLTDDLVANGPSPSASGSYYDVTGTHLAATVDAVSGSVISVFFTDSQASGGKGQTSKESIATAEAFLTEHGIAFDGMTQSVEKMDHGETWDWDVKWSRYAGDVLLPDSIEVGITPAGEVFSWAWYRQPYSSPPAAQIDQATAEAAAIAAAFPDAPQTKIESTQLTLKVDADGNQRLVWDVQVTGWVTMSSGPAMPIDHAWVEVDAETGAATVVGVG